MEEDSSSTKDARKRSRSPTREDSLSHTKRHRSRSPHRHSRHHHHHHHRDSTREITKTRLPFKSGQIHKNDFDKYKNVFAEYLDLQKQINIEELDRDEVKGRWKSFLGKWNRGELAEGWYDPELKERADARAGEQRLAQPRNQKATASKTSSRRLEVEERGESEEEDDDDDGYGPALPERAIRGPTVPKHQDLQHRRELADEDRQAALADLRYERKQDRKTQKERLEEIAPRADPGSRERLLEKKRDVAASNRAFAADKEGGAAEVGDNDLLGEDGIDGYKARRKEMERKKTEREVRKEEAWRARAAEREERLAAHRLKENNTMDMLKKLAQQRFAATASRDDGGQ